MASPQPASSTCLDPRLDASWQDPERSVSESKATRVDDGGSRERTTESIAEAALGPMEDLLLRYEAAYRQLADAEETYRGIVENAPVGLFCVDGAARPLFVNDAMARICGHQSPEHFLNKVSDFGALFGRSWTEEVTQQARGEALCALDAELKLPAGETRWVHLKVRIVRTGERILRYEGVAEDITERKHAAERVHQLAYFDQITGLPNRRQFEERLAQNLSEARSGRATLLVLEVGRFRTINDTLGRVFGDQLLQTVAERIRRSAGPEGVVARLGGSEFAVLIPGLATKGAAASVAKRILSEAGADFTFLGHTLSIRCALGVSMFPHDATDGESLLQHAHVAMDAARACGPSGARFFTEEMHTEMHHRLRVEKELKLALERDEFFLVYQPQVDARTGMISGLEALVRWQHPERGLVPPNDFIEVAESSGLILPLGEWVLRTACRQAMKWQQSGLPPVPVAVNVSAIQFRQHGFCELVRSVLEETGLDPRYLELELTEGLLLTNEDVVFTLIQELKQMGVILTIDDFGTGYSSLSYLRQFKVNRLKIDRSFVRDVPVNADDCAITTAIIHMAKSLNLDVLAEGVENAEQLSFLREQDCHGIQGYYFSKPVGVDQVAQKLQAGFA